MIPPTPPPDLTGSFNFTASGLGAYGEGARIGDAFVKITANGQLLAWNVSSPPATQPLQLRKIALVVGTGKLSIRYYYAGSWKTKYVDLSGSTWAWEDEQVSGLITGGTWKATSEGISLSIRWNQAFTSAYLTGSIRTTLDVDAMPLRFFGSIRGTATLP